MAFWDWLTGKDDKIKDYSPYTDEQEQFINRILQKTGPLNDQGMDYLRSILSNDPAAFSDFEAPYQQQFQEETIPAILERFSSLGASSSSALNNSLARAGKDLSMGLASQRANLKDSALGRLQQFNQTGLTQQKQPYVKQGSPGALSALSPMAGPLAGNAFDFLSQFMNKNWGGAASGSGSISGNSAINAFR